jgi:DNA-binding MarR family transcriptional regulator
MTDRSTRAVYDFIRAYSQAHRGFPPSIREIARGAYLAPSTVIRHLDKLEAWGLIERQPHLPRSIRLTEKTWPEG